MVSDEGAAQLEAALSLPNGARFFKIALQVNPFAYSKRLGRIANTVSEADYTHSLVAALVQSGIEVIGVMDHHRIAESRSLIEAATAAGINVFPGFEAQSKDGIHVLCLFEIGTDLGRIERCLGGCGIDAPSLADEPCKYDISELLAQVVEWGAIAVAAHAVADKGLLTTLSGRARINAWRDDNLLAVAIAGPAREAPQSYAKILLNINADYHRDRPPAVVNCNDVSKPDDTSLPQVSTFIKMSGVSIEGLRQAFLDPESRIRLNADPAPEDRMELVAMTWEGGFLDGAGIHFNSDLNVLIGGRGTGKSTVIESLRYVFQLPALSAEAKEAHEKIIRNVVKSGTKISLLVRAQRPAPQDFRIERTVPNAAIVTDQKGRLLKLTPLEIFPGVAILGQHEIAEIARSKDTLTALLTRFAAVDHEAVHKMDTCYQKLARSRSDILKARRSRDDLSSQVATEPSIAETLRRYEEAGLQAKLRDQSLLVREEQVIKTFEARLSDIDAVTAMIDEAAPIDLTFLSDEALVELPAKEVLAALRPALAGVEGAVRAASRDISRAIQQAREKVTSVKSAWAVRKADSERAYGKVLRDLQKGKIDGEEFIRLQRRMEELKPKKDLFRKAESALGKLNAERLDLLNELDELRRKEFRRLELAAKHVSARLGDKLRIRVEFLGNRSLLAEHLKKLGGRLSEAREIVMRAETFSLREFARAVDTGAEELGRQYSIPQIQAEKFATAAPEWKLQLEELELPPTTRIELNVGTAGAPEWRELDDLSTGQKATAVLLLLLIDSEAPLIVDQPEDDLDNRFISDSVVPRIRESKR